jgi:putative transcriptional regulator
MTRLSVDEFPGRRERPERLILTAFRSFRSAFRRAAHFRTAEKRASAMESRLDIEGAIGYSELESWLYMEHTVINHVKELRTARGWTQEQLAQATGVSRQSINSIERNRYVPSLELALLFARVFGCPTEHIFQLENEK